MILVDESYYHSTFKRYAHRLPNGLVTEYLYLPIEDDLAKPIFVTCLGSAMREISRFAHKACRLHGAAGPLLHYEASIDKERITQYQLLDKVISAFVVSISDFKINPFSPNRNR